MIKPWQFLLDLVLPRFCVSCKKEGTWLCDSCFGMIQTTRTLPCPFCETVVGSGKTCEKHRPAALDGLLSCGYYHDPILRQTIQRFKYGFAEELSKPLGALLTRTLNAYQTIIPTQPLILPIPLSKTRFRKRGFNQSQLLAEIAAQSLKAELSTTALIRVSQSAPQALRSATERRTNLEDAFAVNKPSLVRGKNIILIDDVSTTGTTLEVATRALKNAGAATVFGLVLARG